jgi:hypothetical protein
LPGSIFFGSLLFVADGSVPVLRRAPIWWLSLLCAGLVCLLLSAGLWISDRQASSTGVETTETPSPTALDEKGQVIVLSGEGTTTAPNAGAPRVGLWVLTGTGIVLTVLSGFGLRRRG